MNSGVQARTLPGDEAGRISAKQVRSATFSSKAQRTPKSIRAGGLAQAGSRRRGRGEARSPCSAAGQGRGARKLGILTAHTSVPSSFPSQTTPIASPLVHAPSECVLPSDGPSTALISSALAHASFNHALLRSRDPMHARTCGCRRPARGRAPLPGVPAHASFNRALLPHTPAQVAAAVQPEDVHLPRTTLVCLENTTNKGGGALYSLQAMQEIAQVCACACSEQKAAQLQIELLERKLLAA